MGRFTNGISARNLTTLTKLASIADAGQVYLTLHFLLLTTVINFLILTYYNCYCYYCYKKRFIHAATCGNHCSHAVYKCHTRSCAANSM